MATRREFSSGMKDLQDAWSNKIETHLERMDKVSEPKGVIAVLRVIPHLLSLFFTVFVIWTAKPATSIFSWHPTLMTMAFMLFMSEAIMNYSPWFSLIPTSPRDAKTRWHWLVNAAAMICAYTGLACISYNKYINDALHYTTWHGLAGILVCGTLAIQASGGIIQMYPTLLPFTIKRVILKRLHAFSGSVTFTGAMVTLVLGLYTTWFCANVENAYLWGLCCACPVVIFSTVFFQFIKNHFVQMFRNY